MGPSVAVSAGRRHASLALLLTNGFAVFLDGLNEVYLGARSDPPSAWGAGQPDSMRLLVERSRGTPLRAAAFTKERAGRIAGEITARGFLGRRREEPPRAE